MSGGRYITAPFIRRVDGPAGAFFVRIDPHAARRRAVAATSPVESLLRAFARGAERSDVAAAGDEAQLVVDVLVDCELLLPAPTKQVTPPSFELEITNRCNAVCVMCPREELRPLGHMDERTFAALVRICEQLPTGGFSLQGIGEPTLHPRLEEWVRTLRRIAPAAPIMMVTNGFRLDSEHVARLRAAGLTHLQWSFHSLDGEVYDEIMGVRRFADVRARLEACLRDHADILSINMVLLESNRREVDELRQWVTARGLSAARLRVIPCFSRGGHVDVDTLLRRSESPAQGRCLYMRKTIFVAWNGDLLPCSSDIAGAHVYGNVNELPASDLFARWRDELLANPVAYDICKSCDHHTRGTLETSWFAGVRGVPVEWP